MKAIPWVTVSVVAGFLLGFGLGAATRKQASKAVTTSMDGGVLDVRVDTVQMLREGATSFLDGLAQ